MNNKLNVSLDNNHTKNKITLAQNKKIDLHTNKNIQSSLPSRSQAEIKKNKLKDNKKNDKNDSISLEIKLSNNFNKIENETKNLYINNRKKRINNENILKDANINITEKNENKNKNKSGTKSESNLIFNKNKIKNSSNLAKITKEIYSRKEKDIKIKTYLNTKLTQTKSKNRLNITKNEIILISMANQKKKKLFHSPKKILF